MPESITVNGVNLSTLVRNVESLTGLLRAPARRGENLRAAGRHGTLLVPRKLYDAGEMVLPLWVLGADAVTGANLSGDAAVTAFYQRVDELLSLFSGVVTIKHTLPDGSARQCLAEVSEVLEFTRERGSPLFGRVAVALTIPGAFWEDPVPRTQTITGTSGSLHSLTEFAGATAPMDDLRLTFTGPITNPKLTDATTGRWVAYDATLPTGQGVVIDCALWTVLGLAGELMSQVARRSSDTGRWFELAPGAPGQAPTVHLSHVAGGAASMTFYGKRKFLVG